MNSILVKILSTMQFSSYVKLIKTLSRYISIALGFWTENTFSGIHFVKER